ncbi:MAG: ABC transporter substrate-binding protein [Deltaproteobacteria bacterium]|jgi:iron complex transport system substrate-binding protein|nr:ABC transporter substrate-binding protein [Deltaproteobacteria bacterium]
MKKILSSIFLQKCPFLFWAALFFFGLFYGSPGAWARQVTDVLGLNHEVPDQVERIVALGSSMMFITFLGAQDLVVGVEQIEKTLTSKPFILVNHQRFKDLPIVGSGGSSRLINYEEIIKLKPQVVFLTAISVSDTLMVQKKLGIPVIALSYTGKNMNFDPSVLIESLNLAGTILGFEDRAAELASYLLQIPQRLSYDPGPGKRAVAYLGGLSMRGNRDILSTTSQSFTMELAHIDNIMARESSLGQSFINREHLLTLNPEIIFVDSNTLPLLKESVQKEPSYYQRLKAFTEGRAFLTLPHTSYHSNPETQYTNAFLMAKAAYPEAYQDLDLAQVIDEIFTVLDGVPLLHFYQEHFSGYGRLTLKGDGLVLEER